MNKPLRCVLNKPFMLSVLLMPMYLALRQMQKENTGKIMGKDQIKKNSWPVITEKAFTILYF